MTALRWPLAVLLAVALAACSPGSGDSGDGAEEVVVGVIVPLSGMFEAAGRNTVNALSLALAEIEDRGGLAVGDRRRPIRLAVEDDGGRTDLAVAKAVKLIDGDGAVALIGLPVSREAIAVAGVAERRQVPMITTKASHPDVTKDKRYTVRMTFSDDFQGRVLADFAVRQLGIREVAVVTDGGSAYSLGLAESFQEAFERRGGTVVVSATLTADDSDLSDLLARVRAAGVRTVFLPVHTEMIRKVTDEVEGTDLDVIFLGGDSWDRIHIDRKGLPRPAYFTDVWVVEDTSQASRDFVRRFRDAYGFEPSPNAALTYDTLHLLAAAIEKVGAADSESIRRGLRSLGTFQGVTGTLRLGDSGDPQRTALIVGIHEDGSRYVEAAIEPTGDGEDP